MGEGEEEWLGGGAGGGRHGKWGQLEGIWSASLGHLGEEARVRPAASGGEGWWHTCSRRPCRSWEAGMGAGDGAKVVGRREVNEEKNWWKPRAGEEEPAMG